MTDRLFVTRLRSVKRCAVIFQRRIWPQTAIINGSFELVIFWLEMSPTHCWPDRLESCTRKVDFISLSLLCFLWTDCRNANVCGGFKEGGVTNFPPCTQVLFCCLSHRRQWSELCSNIWIACCRKSTLIDYVNVGQMTGGKSWTPLRTQNDLVFYNRIFRGR